MKAYKSFRQRLERSGVLRSTLVRLALYLLGVDALLYLVQKALALLKSSASTSLSGWVQFLTVVVVVLLAIPLWRWFRRRLMWRLRNRLVVTYVFIGVIPVALLAGMALLIIYLFVGQFATFLVTSSIQSELKSQQATNTAIAQELQDDLRKAQGGPTPAWDVRTANAWRAAGHQRSVHAWLGEQPLPLNSGSAPVAPLSRPRCLKTEFAAIVRDHGLLFLRAATLLPAGGRALAVVTSRPFDKRLIEEMTANLGHIFFVDLPSSATPAESSAETSQLPPAASPGRAASIPLRNGKVREVPLRPTISAGQLPPASGRLDQEVSFATRVMVSDWDTGAGSPALLGVVTRLSTLYARLFAALGDQAPVVETILVIVAMIFAVIELLALLIGMRLTRTMTRSVAALYDATQHVNRGQLGHRIPVRSNDQLASLETSFNHMTASLQRLMAEQKEKQRMENELAIAQEVQAQLFPRQISQLKSLEVHGVCRPARTVSGDYYDFLPLAPDKLALAVGDVSGKGISAALLMATIHSAVRAYMLEGTPAWSAPLAVGASTTRGSVVPAGSSGAELSPALLLALLNRQLYHSTPAEKYATLFLGMYDGGSRTLTYTNAGHLPPVVLGRDGSRRLLEHGGTVVGLFDDISYDENTVALRSGDLFLAYSDGLTEPENDFGEFGEQRLIALVQKNRDLPLARISDAVTAAITDWIGGNEQPDDVTLVLARAR